MSLISTITARLQAHTQLTAGPQLDAEASKALNYLKKQIGAPSSGAPMPGGGQMIWLDKPVELKPGQPPVLMKVMLHASQEGAGKPLLYWEVSLKNFRKRQFVYRVAEGTTWDEVRRKLTKSLPNDKYGAVVKKVLGL